MSDESSNAQVVASYAAFVQGNYYSVAARALFIWDYLATLDREIEYVWGQRLSAASILFVVNRYVNLLITVLELVEQAPFQTPKVPEWSASQSECLTIPTQCHFSCPPVVRILQSLLIFSTFIVAAFATLRVYAVWSRNWRPALPVFLLALMTPVANLYMDITGTPIPAPRPSVGCAIQTNIAPNVYSQIVIAERTTTTAYDALVLIFTFIKTSQARRAAMSLSRRPSLVALILRDGTMYFLLLVVMNIAQIVVAAEFPGNNFVAFFISPLTSILISRFLLNLREVAQEPEQTYQDTTDTAIISTRFPSIHIPSSVLGNIGASLKSGFDAETAEGLYEEKISAVSEPSLTSLLGKVRRTDIELSHIA